MPEGGRSCGIFPAETSPSGLMIALLRPFVNLGSVVELPPARAM